MWTIHPAYNLGIPWKISRGLDIEEISFPVSPGLYQSQPGFLSRKDFEIGMNRQA
jgi:hypothetical protein